MALQPFEFPSAHYGASLRHDHISKSAHCPINTREQQSSQLPSISSSHDAWLWKVDRTHWKELSQEDIAAEIKRCCSLDSDGPLVPF